uniref:Uncharacterized protein n=1 Tax=Lepeophtheirus salmonis TaxID=72036 RepID=A0A0K2SYK0_LEPSM
MASPSSSPAMALSLRSRQINTIQSLLKADDWKVLVYDSSGEDIICPLMKVKDLREFGVTLNAHLKDESREFVPDVTALYLVLPSSENIQRIIKDLEKGLYDAYKFFFLTPIPRHRLEEFASGAFAAPNNSIKSVVDQYLNFISLEENMFILGRQKAVKYESLHKIDVTDTEMDQMIEQMVDGLFSVCVTLCTVPIIRCPKGNAAEAVARKLDAKIRQNLSDARNSLFTHESGKGQYSFCRPVLIILDRQIDLATSLHHTWTYQALAHDVLNYSMNKVTIVEKGSGESETSGKKTRGCSLDPTDTFWNSHKGTPFPQVAEKIQEDLEEYKTREDQIKKIKHELGLDEEDLLTGNTEKLTSAMSSLPELLEKKRLIDMHTSIATCILDHIKQRRLDVFFELEEKIMSKQTLNERALLDIFEDPEAGTPEDKIRLFLIYFLCSGEEVSDTEIEQYERILSELGCDITPFHYLKRWRTINQLHSSNFTQSTTTDYTGGGTKTISMFGKLMAQSSSFVMEGVKNFVVKKHALPATKITEEIMEVINKLFFCT